MKNILHRTWEEEFFDGKLDPLCEDFCETENKVVRFQSYIVGREAQLQSEDKREAEIDNWNVLMNQGKIQRIR